MVNHLSLCGYIPPIMPGGMPPIPPIPGGIPPDPPGFVIGPGDLLAMTSSTRSSIVTASTADLMTCFFTRRGSITFIFHMSAVFPSYTFTPYHLLAGVLCFCLSSTMMSIGSIPAFWAIVTGIASKASAKALIASCSLPSVLVASVLSLLLSSASDHDCDRFGVFSLSDVDMLVVSYLYLFDLFGLAEPCLW